MAEPWHYGRPIAPPSPQQADLADGSDPVERFLIALWKSLKEASDAKKISDTTYASASGTIFMILGARMTERGNTSGPVVAAGGAFLLWLVSSRS